MRPPFIPHILGSRNDDLENYVGFGICIELSTKLAQPRSCSFCRLDLMLEYMMPYHFCVCGKILFESLFLCTSEHFLSVLSVFLDRLKSFSSYIKDACSRGQ